jgi:hypothetical protein
MCKWASSSSRSSRSSSDSYTCCRFWTNLQCGSTIDNLCTIIELSKSQWRSTKEPKERLAYAQTSTSQQFVLKKVMLIVYRDRVRKRWITFIRPLACCVTTFSTNFSCHLCPDDCSSCLCYHSLLTSLVYAHTTWRLSLRHPRLPDWAPRTLYNET